MKVLIGTPIRDIKEYGIRRWLKSVSELNWDNYLLFMVDNSDTPDFSERVKKYCQEINFTKYELLHLEDMGGRESEARLVLSREEIRKKLLSGDWQYWFSWECDIVLPSNVLKELFRFVPEFDVVNHNYPDKQDKNMEVGGIGCSIYKREILERFSFLEGGGYAECDPLMLNCYYSGDSWLARRVLRTGYKVIDLHNLFEVKHLGQQE